MVRIAISDIHLCRGAADSFRFDHELARFLNSALRHLGQLEVILNGDIFDFIAIDEEGDIEKLFAEISLAHSEVFDAFKNVARQAHLVLIPGNHDHQLRNHDLAEEVKKFIPGIEVASNGQYNAREVTGGLETLYHFEHGDAHDPWASLVSPQNGEKAKTNVIVKDMMREFFAHPFKIISATPGGAAVEALERTLSKFNLEAHERRLFEEKVKPLIRRFKVNAVTLWRLANSLSVNRIKEFGKLYVAIVGAEIAHGEEPFYRTAAERITDSMDASARRVISFGHTHKPEVIDLGNGAIYANSGTWGYDIKKAPPDRFCEITKGTYLLFTKETLSTGKGILNYFIPPVKRFVL